MTDLPRGTVTFLFTDIEGSTRLWQQQPTGMMTALRRHDAIMRRVVRDHGGYVFKMVGDACCAAFATAPDALNAAIAGQRALCSEPWNEDCVIKVRMALHTGAAEERDNDYFGPPLNRVARLLSAGYGGQVLLSAATQGLVRDHLPPGVELHDMGQHRLKDLIEPEHIFQLAGPDLANAFPPLKTLDGRPNNLPLQATTLVGREREVAAVTKLLMRPEVRQVTLTGPGGTGKTRLGLQAAAELLDEFEDGVYFVALSPITDPSLVVSTIARNLGVQEAGGLPLLVCLKDHLRDKRLLLVLDNFEQLADAAPVVTELLSAAPGLKVVVTSRAVLHLYGEHDYAVPPLGLPDLRRLPPVERMAQYEAVKLFRERAQAAKADFTITEENAAAVAEICYRLDGLPLAIELAAARVRLLTPQAMLPRLSNRLKLLTGGARDREARQQSLRGAIDWSYSVLEPGEQMLFSRLSVFVGGCSLESVEAVCNAGGDLEVDVLDGVATLVDNSLLRQGEGVDGEPRFLMLQTMREYGRERLESGGEAGDLGRHHAEHFLALAEEAEPQLRRAQQATWLERLEREHDNLRAALVWFLDGGMAEQALTLAGALSRFWEVRGHWSEGRKWLEDALALGGSVPGAVRAKALNGAGWLASQQGDYGRAITLLEESLALRREGGNKWSIAITLNNLGAALLYHDEIERARALFEESLALSRELQDNPGVAASLSNLGMVALRQGDYARALTLLEESLSMRREQGSMFSTAISLKNLGLVAHNQGDYERAMTLLEESLALRTELGDKVGIAYCLEQMAGIALAQARVGRATRLLGAAEKLREAIGTPVPPADRALHERHLKDARAQLGEEAFAVAWREGGAMTMEQALTSALEQTVPAV